MLEPDKLKTSARSFIFNLFQGFCPFRTLLLLCTCFFVTMIQMPFFNKYKPNRNQIHLQTDNLKLHLMACKDKIGF